MGIDMSGEQDREVAGSVKLHSATTVSDLANLHDELSPDVAAVCLGQYRALVSFCQEHDLPEHNIQVAAKARHLGGGLYLFFELGGGDATAWVAEPPPEFLWGAFRPSAQARIWHPAPFHTPGVQRGSWLYPLEHDFGGEE